MENRTAHAQLTNFRRLLAVTGLAMVAAWHGAAPAEVQDNPVGPHAHFEIHFATDSIALSPEGRQTLAQVAAEVTERGLTRVMITGHADSVGTEAYNLTLSRKRAQAVVAELRNLGLPAGILFADWKGEYAPVDPGANETPSAPNRRVSIDLSDQP